MIIIRDFISRTARKDGRCEVCGWNIGKGEEYRVSHSFQYYVKLNVVHSHCKINYNFRHDNISSVVGYQINDIKNGTVIFVISIYFANIYKTMF